MIWLICDQDLTNFERATRFMELGETILGSRYMFLSDNYRSLFKNAVELRICNKMIQKLYPLHLETKSGML